MTLAQYKSIMANVTDINEEVAFIFTSENTKIMTDRYPKIEFDEANELIKAYILHPKSTKEKPIYLLSFVCTLDSVFSIRLNAPYSSQSFLVPFSMNHIPLSCTSIQFIKSLSTCEPHVC